ncbi:MAG TPA: hypothetical protein VHE53_00145 [Patescibacteria group bacterium]|nr:hypothetical protein [Patescibacteria group bacterium]
MASPDNYDLRGIPPRILEEGTVGPFEKGFYLPYPPLSDLAVKDDACKVPVPLVRQMPFGFAGTLSVAIGEEEYDINLLKTESFLFIASVRLFAKENWDFRMDAHIRRPRLFKEHMARFDEEFASTIPSNVVALSYDLATKVDGEHYPGMRAATFVPWAYSVLKPFKPTHILAEWYPDSDNHAAFYKALGEGASTLEAFKSTWSHKHFSQLGELIPNISVTDKYISEDEKAKYEAYSPSTTVRALYKI